MYSGPETSVIGVATMAGQIAATRMSLFDPQGHFERSKTLTAHLVS